MIPTKARVYPSGAALTHPIVQSYVLSIGFAFTVDVAWALVVEVVLIVEHAVKIGVLDVVILLDVVAMLDVVDVTIFELEVGAIALELAANWLDVKEIRVLEVVEETTTLEVVEEATLDEEEVRGPVFLYKSSLG